MKIHGIEEVSKMLAEFDFAGVKGEVAIEVSPYEDAELYYDDDECDCCDWDTCRIKLYDGSELNLEAWDEKAWTRFIEEEVEKVQYMHLMGCTRCGKEYAIDMVYIEYESSSGDDKVLCELCSVVGGNGFDGIYVPEQQSVPFEVFISLEDMDAKVEGSDDVIGIVCACTELSKDDFVRVK